VLRVVIAYDFVIQFCTNGTTGVNLHKCQPIAHIKATPRVAPSPNVADAILKHL
jgi:hypothetical protein